MIIDNENDELNQSFGWQSPEINDRENRIMNGSSFVEEPCYEQNNDLNNIANEPIKTNESNNAMNRRENFDKLISFQKDFLERIVDFKKNQDLIEKMLEEDRFASQEQIKLINDNLNNKINDYESLNAQYENKQNEIENKKKEHENITKEIDDLKLKKEEVEATCEIKNKEVKDLIDTQARFQKLLEKLTNDQAIKESRNKALDDEKDKLEKCIDELNNKKKFLEKLCDDYDSKNSLNNDSAKKSKEDLETVENELSAKKSKLGELNLEMKTTICSIANLKKENEDSKANAEILKNKKLQSKKILII